MDFIIVVVVVAVVVVAAYLVLSKLSKNKSRWGLGAWRPNCPRCGTPLPMIRKPASKEEMMWGGWTCPKCGCKVDKYGQERAAA